MNITHNIPELLNNERILEILKGLETMTYSPIEREFGNFVTYWAKKEINGEHIHAMIDNSRRTIQELLAMRNGSEQDEIESKSEIRSQIHSLRSGIGRSLSEKIIQILNEFTGEEKDFIHLLLSNKETHPVIPIGILLLLNNIKEYPKNQKAQWLQSALRNVLGIKRSIDTIASRNSGDKVLKKMVFGEFSKMYQESFAAISAIGCHMYLEDCSVLMQPVKVKYIEVNQGKNKKVSHKEIQIGIEEILGVIDKGKKIYPSHPYFPELEEFLSKEGSIRELIKGSYLCLPLVVDAKDIISYLQVMNKFFQEWVKYSGGKNSMFSGKKRTKEKSEKFGGQPRIKFTYSEFKIGKFNMRLDYNNSKLDMDVGGVNYILENGGTLGSLLREQSDIPIIANSYKPGTGRDTGRIMNNPGLNLGERMALVHSAMMQQGCNVLGRNENRIFGYHYTLISDFPESRFTTLQRMFHDFEEY